MAEPRRWYLMTYDIRSPKRWRKVYELMRGYGERLQLSVGCTTNLRSSDEGVM
jgi:CRISPR-associated protein Cas2